MKQDRFWLFGLTLIAFALRLFRLGEQSLWYDEGVTWMLSQMQSRSLLIEWTAADIQPPLYYLLIWQSDLYFASSEWALRFPSAVFGILTLPVIYILARRLAPTHRFFPLLAATIFAISPVMIYYSQEARMYTLLVLEASLSSYFLLRVIQPTKRLWIWIGGYVLIAAMALYTHYFAAFLLVAHGAFLLITLTQRRFPKHLLVQSSAMIGGAILLFAPWLSILISRLGDDPSYWPGALKLEEVVRKLLITFAVGETVFEDLGQSLMLGYLGIFVICILWLLAGSNENEAAESNHQPSQNSDSSSGNVAAYLFLALWLFVPILCILLLSYQSPKFNPRYTLLSYPAFVLLLAFLLSQLIQTTQKTIPNASQLIPRLIFTVSTLFVLGTSGFSLYNWFEEPDFSKDDFQAMAQFVKERIAEDETVLLSSGHLFPVWAYYYGWDNWTPLPWMQRLDVNQVTTLNIASDIAEGIRGYEGVWLVTWQDEVIDPNNVVPFWLDVVGERPNDAGDFWGVGLEHWRFKSAEVNRLLEDPIARAADSQSEPVGTYNFADKVELLGSTQLNDNEFVLFWRSLQPLPENLILSLDLTDEEGHDWDKDTLVTQLGSEFYPPSRWPVGEIIPTRHTLPWQLGAPPGLYVAEIGLGQTRSIEAGTAAASDFEGWDILDSQGRPQRRTALIDFVNLSHLVEPETGTPPIAEDPQVDLLPIVGIRRAILPETTAEPGDRLLLAAVWQAGEYNVDNISIAFDLIDSTGETFRVGNSFTPSRNYNLPRWKIGSVVLGQYWLDIPPEAAPGPAEIQIHIINVSGYPYDEVFPLETIEILPTERNFTPPNAMDVSLEANFSEQAYLLGLDCSSGCQAEPGEALTLTLYWQAAATFDKSYTVFTHLLDDDETVLVNADHAPPKPTQGWIANEIITDEVTLSLPADISPGTYAVEIGLYDAADPAFTRLPLVEGENRVMVSGLATIK